MKFTQIEQALEVARTGSLAKAAQNLYISQANLSIAIKNLEAEAGTPIFDRTNRGMELTQFGRQFISYAKSVAFQMRQLEEICTDHKTKPAMSLRIGNGCFYFVHKAMTNLFEKHRDDNIVISMKEERALNIIKSVGTDEVDIAVVSVNSVSQLEFFELFASYQLEFHPLTTTVPGVYVSVNDERFPPDLEYIEPHMLEGIPYVDYTHYANFLPQDQKLISQSTLGIMGIKTCPQIITINNRGAKYDVIDSVHAFSIASYCKTAYDKIGYRPGIRFIPWKEPRFTNEVGWLTRINSPKNELVDEFIEELKYICTP